MTGLWGIKYGKEKVTSTTPVIEKSGRKGKGKGRSEKTYKNKLRKLKSYYNRKVKESKKAKEKKRGKKNHVYFFIKYPSFKDYGKVLNIKEATK